MVAVKRIMVKYGKWCEDMANTLIYMVRHGESLGNATRRILGHTDLGLSERGVEQASACARALSLVSFDKIYSSDLIRAYETALPHAELRGMEVICDVGLREIYMGDWENVCVYDINETELYRDSWRCHFGTFIAPNGERVIDLAERIERRVIEIARDNPGKTLLLVSHAAAIRALFAKISGLVPEEWNDAFEFPTNASFTTLKYDGERLIPCEYSCDSHILESLPQV